MAWVKLFFSVKISMTLNEREVGFFTVLAWVISETESFSTEKWPISSVAAWRAGISR